MTSIRRAKVHHVHPARRRAPAWLTLAALSAVVGGGIAAPVAASAGQVTNTRTGTVYATLASAVGAATADDTLVVDGALVENVTIDRDLTLVGNPGASITSGATQILLVNAGITLTVDGFLLDGTANTQGIRAVAGGATISVMNSTLSTGTTAANAHGGGLEVVNPVFVLLDNVVFDGVAGTNVAALGGGVYVDSNIEVPLLLTDVIFENLKTSNNGGALWGRNVDLVCTNCTFDHVVGGFGGSINTSGGHLTVTQSEFCGGQGSLGGAIFSTAATTIRSTTFVEGRATSNGGAIFANGGTWTIENNSFIGVNGPNVVRMPSLATLTTLENNLVWANPGTKGLDITVPLGNVPDVQYNWFHANGGNVNGFVLDATNITNGGLPRVVAWSQDSNCTNDELWPALGSPLVDAGDPVLFDPDGSRSDIGAFGGQGADPFYFIDHDGDGVIYLEDCDDNNPEIFAGNPETCDGIDNDCNGTVDDNAIDQDSWHEDCDGDGQGKPTATVVACVEPATPPACAGGVWLSFFDLAFFAQSDCDDTNASTYFGAPESCAAGDQNCDGDPNQGATDKLTYYSDGDADGFGVNPVLDCSPVPPPGTAAVNGDCDDADGDIYPGAPDTCGDGIDQDCNGVDGNPSDLVDWFPDADGDGYGDPNATPVLDCRPGAGLGYVADNTDCNDADPGVHPSAAETCDGVDQDCNGAVDDTGKPVSWTLDADLDTYGDDAFAVSADCQPAGYVSTGGDCNDADATIHPGAAETCDGVDQDCNGTVDDTGIVFDFFADADADAFGDAASAVNATCIPLGYVTNSTDCNDADASVYPGALETCNGVDDDCNGAVDDTGDATTWYADTDGDGAGDPANAVTTTCPPGAPYVAVAGDCNDADATVFPGAAEVCDGRDENCDGTVDNTGAALTWYADADSDGFGDPANTVVADCLPAGYVADATDCNDADPFVYPGSPETCDGVDQDCDGTVDNTGAQLTWHPDTDGDSFGDGASAIVADCQPGGYVADGTDCDDALSTVFPGAGEVCNGIDDDCDGTVDNTGTPSTWYADADADGFGNAALPQVADCQPAGTVTDATDCDDSSATVFPGADELCNGVDDDCDAVVDNTGAFETYYADADADGYGDPASAQIAECQPGGTVQDGSDCDDTDANIHPSAVEVCNGVDDDCDAVVDNTGAPSTWYADSDSDGFGDASTSVTADCLPPGYVADGTDCDDANGAVHPGAVEVCNGADDDCDAVVDNTGSTATWYADADADGFGDPTGAVVGSCQPAGTVVDATDCDDADASVHPGALETCNSVDDDCNGAVDDTGPQTTWYADTDGDTFGDANTSQTTTCPPGEGWVTDGTDCDDTAATVFPGAPETCDGVDEDCDGAVDDTGPAGTWYADADADGFGDPSSTVVTTCPPGAGFVANGDDCNDADAGIFPGAPETCDGVDEDCDGVIDDTGAAVAWHADVDCDGFGDPANTVIAACAPAGTTADASDCDDSDAAIHPGAAETCDGQDEDCDGAVDEDAGPTSTWYADVDGDGHGNPNASEVTACPDPGQVATAGDCNDSDAGVHPGAPETCDGRDQDCDGAVDDVTPTATYYTDSDHDSYGNSATAVVTGCPASGAVTVGGDCNDANSAVRPGATEVRNSVDDDCDGQVDEGLVPAICETCYLPHPWWYVWCWPSLAWLFGC